jgi:hypothetical protein
MIISAILTNSDNCSFDSVTFEAPSEAAGIKAAKRWAAGRGGPYGLEVSILKGHGEGYYKSIGDFYYAGKCRRAVAL